MRIGSLFTGYGGLDLAVEAAFNATVAWYAECDLGPARLLAAHYPDAPNLGDVTRIAWSSVERVDVITGGYPCQPFSRVGKRDGTHDKRHLWPYVLDAIRSLRPSLVVLENVKDHLTLGFSSVLGDLAGVGYFARWGVVRASDAGAPHDRPRLFVVAYTDRDLLRHSPIGDGVSRADCTATRSRLTGRDPFARTSPSVRENEEGSFRFGPFASGIERWGGVVGRPAPAPLTDDDRLSPEFVEWLMGLDQGRVTGHGLSKRKELSILGNGVVPQQALLAFELLGVAA